MAIIASDDFNRANTTGPDLGTNWTNVSSGGFAGNGFQIVSNHAEPTTLSSDKLEMYTGAVFPADQYAQAKLTVTGTSGSSGPGVAVRCGSDGTCYRATLSKAASDNLDVARFIAGAFTLVAHRTTTWVDGDTLRLEVQGTTLRVYQNGSQVGADMTDSGIASGAAGIAYTETATVAQVDDWEAGSLAAAADDPPIGFLGRGAGW